MPDIHHDLTLQATAEHTFTAITQPQEINRWWTLDCEGTPELGRKYRFYFGPEFDWSARVVEYSDAVIAWEFTKADSDWTGTILRLQIARESGLTRLRFEHTGWPACNAHFRRSSYCWAQYLRLLKEYLEQGQVIAYEDRFFG